MQPIIGINDDVTTETEEEEEVGKQGNKGGKPNPNVFAYKYTSGEREVQDDIKCKKKCG